jgi:hypothetical protein
MTPHSLVGRSRWALRRLWLLAAAALVIVPLPAAAQTGTASIRGRIAGPDGAPAAGVQVGLLNPASGFQRGVLTNESGFYNIAAVPPGTYTLRAVRIGFSPLERTVRLPVGETITLDLVMSATATQLSAVTVVATGAGVDARTPEVSTNVSTEQIENLPLGNRNFLELATLAAGVQTRQAGLSAGGASASNTNLFIDGASYKSDILPGGIAGQDPSIGRNVRGVGTVTGNPFPQAAVQEFRVITQNYKAEYQKATGAVVTAATRSGTNEFHGDAFFFGQDERLFATSYWDRVDNFAQPEYRRSQFGGSLGGPIVRDRTHFFATYESNLQDLETRVQFRPREGLPAAPAELLTGEGLYAIPLRSHLFFGKVDHQLSGNQSLTLSLNLRRDRDQRGFGGGTAATAEERVRNDVSTLQLRHLWSGQPITNEAQVNFQRFNWAVQPTNPGQPRLEFQEYGITRGGSVNVQDFVQDRLELRDDVTWTSAAHVVKGGAVVSINRYDLDRRLNENPVFRFNPTRPGGITSPFEAALEIGNPQITTTNAQLGLYVQDDWTLNDRLTLNLGVRWDVESDALNNDFVTPANVVDAVRSFTAEYPYFDPDDYITDGDDRDPFYGAIQPRVGFSFDLTGENRTVLFGGGGLYYDRVPQSILLDEQLRSQRLSYLFRFSPTGTEEENTVAWNPAYLSREGLVNLIESGQAGRPELYLLKNDQKPPRSVQASLGLRHTIGRYQLSATGTMSNGENYLKYIWGHRNPTNNALEWGEINERGFGNLVISTDEGKTRYRALLLQASRPMLEDSWWGGDINYTLAKTEANHYNDVEDPFAFDYIPGHEVFGFNWVPGRFDERHRIVANVMVRLPLAIRMSTVTTLGSGVPYTLSTGCTDPNDNAPFCADQPDPPAPVPAFMANPEGLGPRSERPEGKWFGPFGKWAYRNVDLRLQKDFPLRSGQQLELSFDVYNLFNFVNFNYDNMEYNLRWDTNQGAGPFRERIPFSTFNARRAQAGIRYTF